MHSSSRWRLLALVGLSIAPPTVLSAIDFSKPCFEGECAYSLPADSGSPGILTISGSPRAITDVTPAAGWVILDCDPNVLAQDIRLVCETDHPSSGCQNVFDHSGPVNKIVRLPDSCGSGPFARIASMKVASDQAIPPHWDGKISRRDGMSPEVHVMTIDSDFSSMDPAQHGDVSFSFVGASFPTAGLDTNEASVDGLWDDFLDGVKAIGQKIGKAIVSIVDAADENLKKLRKLLEEKKGVAPVAETIWHNLAQNVTFPIPVTNPTCPGVKVELTATMHSKGWIKAKVGIVLAGTIVPPKITELAGFGALDGWVEAKATLELLVSGEVALEEKVIDKAMPGWQIDGLISIGPQVLVIAKAQAILEMSVNTEINVAYNFDGFTMWYPKSMRNKSKARKLKARKSELTFGASGSASAKGTLQGVVDSRVEFGIKAFGNTLSATLYVGADTWVRAIVQASASTSTKRSGNVDELAPRDWNKALQSRFTEPAGTRLPRAAAEYDAVEYGVCLWLDAGLRLKAGAQGSMFGWTAEAEFTIWKSPDTWNLLKRCWPSSTSVSKPSYAEDQLFKISETQVDCPKPQKKTLHPKKTEVPPKQLIR